MNEEQNEQQESLDLFESSEPQNENSQVAAADEMTNEEEEVPAHESLDMIPPTQNEDHETQMEAEDIKPQTEKEEIKEPEVQEKSHKFPLGRVKNIMKMDPDVNLASQDSVFLITKALEMFVESLAIEAYSYTANAKKKTVSKQDVEKAIDAVDALAFLDGALDD